MDRHRSLIHRLALGLAALALIATGWGLGVRQSAPQQTAARAEAESRIAPEAVEGSDVSGRLSLAAASAVSPRPLPATAEPLPGALSPLELVAVLEPRARAGDAAAACRLALELAECRGLRYWRERSDAELEQELSRVDQNDPKQLEALERRLGWYATQAQRKRECDALPESIRHQAPSLLLQAALQGNRAAMVGFSNLPGVGGQELVADPQLYTQYRQYAFPLWQRAFESGSVGALQVWVSALSSNGFHFFAGVLPAEYRDLQLAQALMGEVREALGIAPDATSILPRVTAEIDEETALRARELFERHYRDSPGLAFAAEQFQRLESQIAAARKEPSVVAASAAAAQAEHFNHRCSAEW